MGYEKLRLAKAVLTDEVYVGRTNKEGTHFVGDKKNVTADFHRAIIDMYGGYNVIISNGEKHYHLTCEEISTAEKEALECTIKESDNE